MSRDLDLIAWLHRTYQGRRDVKGCLSQTTAAYVFVDQRDTDNSPCHFFLDHEDGFRVINLQQKNIHLFSIDGCFFTPTDDKRCDCLVFDDHDCCFVELKLRVSRHKHFAENAKEAREQLGRTILFFRQAHPADADTFGGLNLEAYVIMQPHVYPRSSASRKHIRAQFLATYKVRLFEEHTKKFRK
jgi:hypothetical protein